MAKKVTVQYRRRDRGVVLVKCGGLWLDREVEPDATNCAFCGAEREYRTTSFFSYDDEGWGTEEGVEAFCNLGHYLAHLANGRMSSARKLLIERALALVEQMDREDRRAKAKASNKRAA